MGASPTPGSDTCTNCPGMCPRAEPSASRMRKNFSRAVNGVTSVTSAMRGRYMESAFTGMDDPLLALKSMAREFRIPVAGVTLGHDGALIYSDGRFLYSPGFVVKTVDTTGAGDVFHGALVYGLLEGWDIGKTLDFSNALAALNCTRLGARGGIATRAAAEELMANGRRQINRAYAARTRTDRG